MKSLTKIFLLLSICISIAYCQSNCDANTYSNNPLLLWSLRGFLYTVYTSKQYESNEVFRFEPNYSTNTIFTRTTNSAGCCKTMNVNAIPESGNYFKYVISNDKTCPIQLTENARMKLLAVNTDNGGYCLILWTCRKSREGLHAFCTHTKLSPAQDMWIQKQYKSYRVTRELVVQNKDLSSGQCFDCKKKVKKIKLN